MDEKCVRESARQSPFNEPGRPQKGGGVWQRIKKNAWIVVVAVAFGNYFVKALLGTDTPEDFTFCALALIFLVFPVLFLAIVRLLKRFIYRKDIALNPATMVLPERGTVTLEDALHKMSTQTGVVVWDVLVGCVIFAQLGVFWVDDVNVPSLLRGLAISAVFMAAGHLLLHLVWKKRSFVKRLIRNSAKYFPAEVHEGYADLVSASLGRGVLSYEKQMILTDNYILSAVYQGIKVIPIAVPREKVTEYVFYYETISRHSYTQTFGFISYKNTFGVLSCRANGETLVDLMIGESYAAQKVLRILNHYQIPWTDRDATRS